MVHLVHQIEVSHPRQIGGLHDRDLQFALMSERQWPDLFAAINRSTTRREPFPSTIVLPRSLMRRRAFGSEQSSRQVETSRSSSTSFSPPSSFIAPRLRKG